MDPFSVRTFNYALCSKHLTKLSEIGKAVQALLYFLFGKLMARFYTNTLENLIRMMMVMVVIVVVVTLMVIVIVVMVTLMVIVVMVTLMVMVVMVMVALMVIVVVVVTNFFSELL